MEIYSKRSALGCVFPVFVAAWYIVALVPASIHSFFASLRRWRHSRELRHNSPEVRPISPLHDYTKTAHPSERTARAQDAERKRKIISAVQGADEDWPVQLSWGIYYIAGTLIFTSLMGVTVIELVCWVGLSCMVTGSSKLLAFFLCLVFEKTGEKGNAQES